VEVYRGFVVEPVVAEPAGGRVDADGQAGLVLAWTGSCGGGEGRAGLLVPTTVPPGAKSPIVHARGEFAVGEQVAGFDRHRRGLDRRMVMVGTAAMVGWGMDTAITAAAANADKIRIK
jgi:hypothetical protein